MSATTSASSSPTLAGRLFKEAGFDLVYDKSYPLGTQDYCAGGQSRQGRQSGRVRRLVLSAGYIRPRRAGQDRRPQRQGLLLRGGCAFQGFSQKIGPAAENVLGAGGVIDSPEIRDFYKGHKEVTGVDADYWGSPFYYAMLQMLTQSIEARRLMDLQAITAYPQDTFKTIVGELDMPRQKLDKFYTVGQWQNGFFNAVAGVGFKDYSPVKLKTSWG